MEKENCYIGGNEWDLEEILKSMVDLLLPNNKNIFFIYSWIFFPISILSHWPLQGHITSKRNLFPPKQFNTSCIGFSNDFVDCDISLFPTFNGIISFYSGKMKKFWNLTSCVEQLEH